MKKTLDEKLHSRKIGKPNFIYNVLGSIWKLLFKKKYGINAIFKTDFRKEKCQYIVIR